TGVDFTLVATRGEHLALERACFRGQTSVAGPFEVATLDLVETGADGLATRWLSFGADDLDAALEELDRRYLDSLPAAEADVAAVLQSCSEHMRRREWAAMRALLTDDCEVVDQRSLGSGTVGADEYVERVRSWVEVAPDAAPIVTAIHQVA